MSAADDQHARAPYRRGRLPSCCRVKITGERVVSPAGGFNPTWQRHVAAYALAEPELGAGPRPRPRLRRRPQLPPARAARDGRRRPRRRRRSPARTARRSWRTCARCRSRTAASRRCCPSSRSSTSRIPSACWRRSRACSSPDGVAVFVTPNRLTLGRPDEIIDPVPPRRVRRRRAARRCASASSPPSRCAACSARERYMELFDEERRKLDRLLRRDPLRLRRAVPVALRRRLYDLMLRRYRHARRPARGRDRAGRLRPARRRPRRRARPRRDLLVAEHGDACVRLVRGSARRGARSGSAGADPLRGVRRGDDRPVADRRGAEPRLRRRGTGRSRAGGSASSATSCCAARAGAWPGGWTRSPRPGPCSTSAPATAR